MTRVDLALARRLVGPDGRAAVAAVGALLAGTDAAAAQRRDPLELAVRVRRATGLDAELAAAATTQVVLRAHAAPKLGADAERMLFTRAGLEQLTAAPVAAHRAARLAPQGGTVLDLGCGLGGDAAALARAGGGRVVAVERDPATALLAAANAAALGLPIAVVQADATTLAIQGASAVFADPARRDGAGRSFDLDALQPPWGFVLGLLAGPVPAAVKAAPGVPLDRVPADVEVEFVSWEGGLKEAVLWSAAAGGVPGGRRATLLPSGRSVLAEPAAAPPPAGPPGAFLVEPDPALIRAGLVGHVAAAVDGRLLDPHLAYVTADTAPEPGWGRRYAVVDVLPYDERRLRQYVAAHRIGRLTVKRRGVDVEPETLRRRLKPRGAAAATLVLSRTPVGAVALVVQPLA
jgi:protein-L-isoaspartate O-methyltransferase